jgi:hypothetical protein
LVVDDVRLQTLDSHLKSRAQKLPGPWNPSDSGALSYPESDAMRRWVSDLIDRCVERFLGIRRP